MITGWQKSQNMENQTFSGVTWTASKMLISKVEHQHHWMK
jgi:hypothetical protein